MPEQPADNAVQKYEVESCAASDLSEGERAACIAIITSGGAVDPDSAAAELPRTAVLAIARTGDKIVGVGAIKRVRAGYAAGIAGESGFAFDPATPEIGYVAIDADHQGNGLSPRIVAALLSKYPGRVFATTDCARMKKTLGGAGFVQKGREWPGQRGQLSFWTRDA